MACSCKMALSPQKFVNFSKAGTQMYRGAQSCGCGVAECKQCIQSVLRSLEERGLPLEDTAVCICAPKQSKETVIVSSTCSDSCSSNGQPFRTETYHCRSVYCNSDMAAKASCATEDLLGKTFSFESQDLTGCISDIQAHSGSADEHSKVLADAITGSTLRIVDGMFVFLGLDKTIASSPVATEAHSDPAAFKSPRKICLKIAREVRSIPGMYMVVPYRSLARSGSLPFMSNDLEGLIHQKKVLRDTLYELARDVQNFACREEKNRFSVPGKALPAVIEAYKLRGSQGDVIFIVALIHLSASDTR